MTMEKAYIEDQLATMRANVRLYEIATNLHMRDLAAEKLVHAFKALDAAGVFDPATGTDPDAPVPYSVTSKGRHAAPEPPVDEPLIGEAARRVGAHLRTRTGHGPTDRAADELDASDRTAMGRLARLAFPSKAERCTCGAVDRHSCICSP